MLSFPEILVILVVAVIVLGPKRLPDTARKIGRWVGIFKQASEEFKRQLMTMDRVAEQSLNHAVNDVDQLEPEALRSYEAVEAELASAFQATVMPPDASVRAEATAAPSTGACDLDKNATDAPGADLKATAHPQEGAQA